MKCVCAWQEQTRYIWKCVGSWQGPESVTDSHTWRTALGLTSPAGTSMVPFGWNTKAKLEGAPRNWNLRPCGEWSTYVTGAWKAELGALSNPKPGLAGRADMGRRTCRSRAVQCGGEKAQGRFLCRIPERTYEKEEEGPFIQADSARKRWKGSVRG